MAQSKWELEKAKRQGSSLSTWEQEKRNRGYVDVVPQQVEEISNRDLLGYINRTSGIESAVEKTIANRPKVEPTKPKTAAEVQNRLESNQVKINGGGANATLQPWNQSPLEKLKSAINSFTGNDGIPEFRKQELAMQDKLFIPEYDMSNKMDRIKAKYRLGQLADTEGVEWAKVAEGEKTTHAIKVSQAIEEMYQRYPDLFLEVQAENPSLFESIKKFVVNIPEATAEMLPTMLNSMKSGALVGGAGALAGGGTAAVAGQLGPQVALPEELATVPGGALFGFMQGSKLGAASYMYQVEKGQAYKTMLDEGVDPDTANKWSTAVGLANAGLEVAQLGTLMKSLGVADDAIKPIASGMLDKYLNTTGKKAAAQFVTGVATETGQEVAQEAISMTGEYGAKKQSGIDAQLFSQENGQRLLDTAIQSAQAFVGLQGAGQVTGSAYRAGKRTIKEKIADRKNIETVVKAVEEQPEILDQPDFAARLDELENTVLESTQNPELEQNEVEWAQATAERIKRAKVGRGQKLQTNQITEQTQQSTESTGDYTDESEDEQDFGTGDVRKQFKNSYLDKYEVDKSKLKKVEYDGKEYYVMGTYEKKTGNDVKLFPADKIDDLHKLKSEETGRELQAWTYDSQGKNIGFYTSEKSVKYIDNSTAQQTTESPISQEVIEPTNVSTESKKSSTKSTMSQRYIDSKQNKDGKQNLYSEDFPEVQPYIKKRAEELLNDLDNTTKGERIPLGDSTAEWTGIPRVTSQTMARIKDYTGASYEDIRSALNGLINGGKKSNTALARRIEIIIDENLIEGYKTFEGIDIPKNNGYIQVRNKIEPNKIEIPEYQPKEYNFEGDEQLTMGLPGENISVFDLDQQGVVEDGKQNDQPSTLSDEEKTRRAFEAAGVQGIVDTVEAQKMVHKQAVEVMKSLGREVVFFKAKKGEKVPDGFVFGNDNRIYVNVNQKTDNMIWHTIGHEFFHTVKNSKKHKEYLYEPLLDYAKEHFTMTQKLAFLDTYSDVPEIQAQLMKDEDALLEEMLADEMGNSFVDKKFWQSIFDYSKELFGRMVSIIENLLSKISGAKYETYISEEVAKNLQDQFTAVIGIIMTDNKISTQELNDVVGDVKYKIRAYHGTPHDFDKFTTEKIGTGEGAQAYGWGLYFAGQKSIAEWYKKRLSERNGSDAYVVDDSNGEMVDILDRFQGLFGVYSEVALFAKKYFSKNSNDINLESFKNELEKAHSDYILKSEADEELDMNSEEFDSEAYEDYSFQLQYFEEAMELVSEWDNLRFHKANTGRLFEVDLSFEPEHMLDWDNSVSNQSKYVTDILEKTFSDSKKAYSDGIAAFKEYDGQMAKKYGDDYRNEMTDEEYNVFESLSDEYNKYKRLAIWGDRVDSRALNGMDIYKILQNVMGSDKEASLLLKSIGISGIKYLDGTSRNKLEDERNYNYVVFADEDVEIASKYSVRNRQVKEGYTDIDPTKKSTSTTADYRMDSMTSNVYKEAATDKVKPIHEIVKDIGRDFKVAVTSKRFKRRKAYAHYKSFPQAIETSVSNTIGPIIHELGHHFDYKYGISKNKKYDGMIQSMIAQMPEIFKANYKSEELKGESIAEFLRIYMTMPSELSEYAGEFVNEFENLISKEDLSKLKKHQSEILGWLNSSIEAQVNSALVSYFKNPKIEAAKKNPKAHMELIVKKAYMHFFNELQPLHDFARYIEKISGKKLSNSQDFYLLADSALRSSMVAKYITTGALLDSKNNVIGDSFKSIFKDITVADYEALSEYLIAKRAIDYDKRGKRAFSDDLPIDYIKKMVDKIEIEKPLYVETANKLYSWWDSFTRAWVVDTGLIEPKLYDYMRELEPHYVPFFRQRDEATIVNGVVKRLARQGFTDQRNPIKRSSMKGSSDPIYYPIESMIMEIERYVTTVKKRDVMLAVHDVYQDLKKDTSAGGKVLQEGLGYIINEVNPQMLPDSVNMKDKKLKLALNLYDAYSETLSPEDKIEYEVIKKDAIEFKATFEDVLNFFTERGFNAMEIVNNVIDDTELEFKPMDIDKETNIVTVKDRQNKTHHYEVYDPFLLEALLNMDTSNMETAARIFALIRRTMQSLITVFDPTFLGRSFLRDVTHGGVASRIPLHKYHMYIVQAIHDEITNGEWSKMYKRSGGGFSSKVGADRNALAESMAETIPGWKKKHKFQTAIQSWEKFADAIEQAPRQAEFRYYVEQNGSSYDSRLKALFEGQDVTVNFQRKGKVMHTTYGQLIPFFNPALQGIDKNVRMNTVDIKNTLPRALFSLTMISLIMFAVNRDDPEYDKLSSYIKDTHWNFPTGINGRYIRVVKPRELGFMYGSSFERVLEQFVDKNPEAWDGFFADMKQIFIPGLRTILGPISDAKANRTWYGGQIVPYAYQKLQPDQQYTNTTSWIAKEMAKLIPDNSQLSSPMVLDYLFQQYTGVIGKTVIPMTDEIEGNAGLSLKKPFVADVAISNDSVRKFYEKLDSMNKIVATAKMGRMPKGSYNEAEHEVYKNTAEAIQEINKLYESIDGMKSEEFKPLNEKTGMSKEELKRFLKLEVLRLATATNKLYNSK